MSYICTKCQQPVFLRRPSDAKPIPIEEQVCYPCLLKEDRREIKSNLGYSRVGLGNI